MAALTQRPILQAGYFAVAMRLQEAAQDLSSADIQARLRDAINDKYRGSGEWAYYIDHFGDADSGDVIYSCGGDTRRASYSISSANGAAACCDIDFDASENVVPRTVYEPEADDADHYAGMQESAKLYTKTPLFERFISKKEREQADSGSFAGKGKSFPILKAGDVMAAVRSLGRAGSDNYDIATIKRNIKRIAKKKGFPLPKAWKDDSDTDAKESLTLRERFNWTQDGLELIEAAGGGTEMEIKLIAPGKGSSAFYPAEVLKRDAGVFKKGTHIYINHATAAEESARPEGDWHKLAGALNTDAYWSESHKNGAGLYAKALFSSDYAPLVREKASFTGMSIHANGDAVMESGRPRLKEGVPELARLTAAHSVDVVTRPGAGGMILTEAARAAQEAQMNETEIKALIATSIKEALAPQTGTISLLERRAIRGDAQVEATRLLESMSLPEASKARVIREAVGDGSSLPIKDGQLDGDKFKTLVEAAAKAEGQYVSALTGSGRVIGMGSLAVTESDPKKAAELRETERKAEKRRLKESRDVFERLGLPKDAAKLAAIGRTA